MFVEVFRLNQEKIQRMKVSCRAHSVVLNKGEMKTNYITIISFSLDGNEYRTIKIQLKTDLKKIKNLHKFVMNKWSLVGIVLF